MSQDTERNSRIERLARRMSDDVRIATPVLVRILATVDAEIAELGKAGQPVPSSVSELRAIMMLAYAQREAGSAPADGTRTPR